MVFESISKGISNLGKGTLKTTKWVMKTTWKVTKVVTDPITWVTKKAIKYVPFVWWDRDIWESVHDRYALEIYSDEVKRINRHTLSHLKKQKLAATKIKQLKLLLDKLVSSLEHETSLKNWEASILDWYKSLWNNIKTTIPTDYIDWKRVSTKKISITASQKKLVKDELELARSDAKKIASQLENLPAYISIKPTSKYQTKSEFKAMRDSNHDKHDDLITAKFDLVTEYKRLYYLILELERQVKKHNKNRNSIRNTKINTIVKTTIPWHQKAIKELRAKITQIEKSVIDDRSKFDDWVNSWLPEVENRVDLNKKETSKLISKTKKSQKKEESKVTSSRKKYDISADAICKKTKKPFTTPLVTQKLIQSEADLFNTHAETEVDRLSQKFAIHLSTVKDFSLQKLFIQENINRTYDSILLDKELSIQTWLLNRIHNKQAKVITKIISEVKKLKTISKDISLASFEKWTKSEQKWIKERISSYTKSKKVYKENAKNKSESIKTYRKTNLYIDEKIEYQSNIDQHTIKKNMIAYLVSDKKVIEPNIDAQTKLLEEISNTLKKSEIQLQENERSAFTLQDKKRSKKAVEFEKQYHAQEVTYETVHNHIDLEKDLIESINEAIRSYTSDNKKLLKSSEKHTSRVKQLQKEIKKNAISKKVL